MRILLMVLLGLAMAGVLGVLAAGMFGLLRGGDPARSNKLMQWRVALQALALILFALLVLLFRS